MGVKRQRQSRSYLFDRVRLGREHYCEKRWLTPLFVTPLFVIRYRIRLHYIVRKRRVEVGATIGPCCALYY